MKKRIMLCLTSLMLLVACGEDGWLFNEEQMEEWSDKVIVDSPSKKYGVRWSIDNPLDLGERCFDATGLRARFGVGKTEGRSDFDQVFPWSQIRRCNVNRIAGQTVITYDDDPRFTTDGTNGDVFVRIPRFYVEKFQKDGYEYRVISAIGDRPHPAFIEDGQVLDAIYVSAFEGYMGSDSLLRSVAGVIPSSNITAQQFLDAARRRGRQYTLYDMRTVDLLFTLIAVEFGCRNTGVIFGHGISDYIQPIEPPYTHGSYYYSLKEEKQTNSITCWLQPSKNINVGSAICICKGSQQDIITFARITDVKDHYYYTTYTFDGPPVDIVTDCFIGNCGQVTNWTETCAAPHYSYMGRANMLEPGFLPRERNPMRYRWMENIVGNLWHFLPDVTLYHQQLYTCPDMSAYCFGCHDGRYVPFGPPLEINTSNGSLADDRDINCWVTSLLADEGSAGISFGSNFSKQLTSKEAFGAYYYVGQGLCILVNGGGFDHRNRCNLLTTRAWDAPARRWHLYGARLLFKDVEMQ